MKYLLDTDIVIWILRERFDVVSKIDELRKKAELHVSVITVTEIYKHIFPSELLRTEELLSRHIQLDINAIIAKQAGLYWQELCKEYRNVSIPDCLIGATAKTHDLVVLSFNTKHFPVKDIKVENPLEL